ncbi:DEAD/DEAH box helicase [Pseudoramibacter faecis]|uniref:DEAD/DEAH box helicase n=1 Tax=Pseudoramibacter faecis TaxID=3108534 RepID=UPI002E7874C0|nr:DEAD/DEAH box helicase family protein [Pseudoramibacter sp. HA2172]
MASNFDFLGDQQDLKHYEASAKNLEQLYGIGAYAAVLTESRTIAENLAKEMLERARIPVGERATFNDNLKALRGTNTPKKVIDVFFAVKGWGNKAAHTLDQRTQAEALKAIRAIYALLGWQFVARGGDRAAIARFEPPHALYQTAERKLIYVQTADNVDGRWPAYDGAEKIGEASVPEGDFEANWEPGSDYLLGVAQRRINQYMTTAGVPGVAQWSELAYRKQDKSWFRDHDVHRVLDRSGIRHQPGLTGNEWYHMDLATAKRAIAAVKAGQAAIDQPAKAAAIALRPEQRAAIDQTKKVFKKTDKMLWNAKMRFGKTITALQLIKEARYPHVLIMTHRPVVDDGWFDDFKKLDLAAAGYHYGSKKSSEPFDHLASGGGPFVYFASLQDLRGSERVGGKAGSKNEMLFATDWDLVIVDEAHEGTQTELAQNVLGQVVRPGATRVLTLSGTPFNLLDQYEKEQVYTWDYVMEQQAKADWSQAHPDLPNPYEGLPQVSMFTFEMSRQFKDALFQSDDKRAFNFKAFFEVNAAGRFVHEAKVKQFLDNITTPDPATNYPFSTPAFRDCLRHTLWILPGVKEASALERLLKGHPVFGMDYKIVNVVAQGDNGGVASEGDVAQVKAAIGEDPAATKTITLTVRKLTTGVTIAPWTGVLFLANTTSAMQYLQAAFRAQTPYASETFGQKTRCYIFDFAPDRALTVMTEATRLGTGAQRDKMAQLMNFLPIIGEGGQGMRPYC